MSKANPSREMTLLEHLSELRNRFLVSAVAILVAAAICYGFYDRLFEIFFRPYGMLKNSIGNTLFINSIFEGFVVKVKLSFFAGIILSFPVHLFNIVRFIFPGLLKRERRIVALSLLASLILVVASFYYGYYYMVPISVRFLTGAGFIPDKVGILLNYGKNIFYVFQLLMLVMLVMQLPVVVEVLMILNVIKRRSLLKASRYIVFAIFIIAAVFTPPDFISQLCVAIPLIALFFLTLLIARICHFGEG